MGIIEKMRLDGKKGFVTGAARGIGKVRRRHLLKRVPILLLWTLTLTKRKRPQRKLRRKQAEK